MGWGVVEDALDVRGQDGNLGHTFDLQREVAVSVGQPGVAPTVSVVEEDDVDVMLELLPRSIVP